MIFIIKDNQWIASILKNEIKKILSKPPHKTYHKNETHFFKIFNSHRDEFFYKVLGWTELHS